MTEEKKVFKLGARSKKRLGEGHLDIQAVVMLAITYTKYDFGVSECLRDVTHQLKLVAEKKSKTKRSRHLPCYVAHGVRGQELRNIFKPGAVDLVGYDEDGVSWSPEIYHSINEAMMRAAKELHIEIRWGGDWDMDGDTTDQTFNDLCHWELTGKKYTVSWKHLYDE